MKRFKIIDKMYTDVLESQIRYVRKISDIYINDTCHTRKTRFKTGKSNCEVHKLSTLVFFV